PQTKSRSNTEERSMNRRSSRAEGKPSCQNDIGLSPIPLRSSQQSRRGVLADRIAVFAICALLICAFSLTAQELNVTLQGRVFDTTGAAISQAEVTAVNEATGVS